MKGETLYDVYCEEITKQPGFEKPIAWYGLSQLERNAWCQVAEFMASLLIPGGKGSIRTPLAPLIGPPPVGEVRWAGEPRTLAQRMHDAVHRGRGIRLSSEELKTILPYLT
jgi:hypothetical protein